MTIYEGLLKTSLGKVEPNLLDSFGVGGLEWRDGSRTLTGVRAKMDSGIACFNIATINQGLNSGQTPGWQWTGIYAQGGSGFEELELAWHFKAFDMSPFVTEDATDGSLVTDWYSFDMNATFSQGKVSAKPQYWSGSYGPGSTKDAIAFDGIDDHLYITDGQSEFTSDWTMFVVLGHWDNTPTNNPIIARSDKTHPNEGTLYGKQQRMYIQDDDGAYKQSSTLTPGEDQIRCVQFDASAKTVSEYVDGTAAYEDASGPDGPFTFNAIGQLQYSGSTAENLTGAISEIFMFNNYLDSGRRQIFEGYLAYKYSLIANLPTGHPYYDVRIFAEEAGADGNYLLNSHIIMTGDYAANPVVVSESIRDGDRIMFYVPGCQNPGQITVELSYS